MIGNDIIDLELAHQESNWQRKGLLNKIMTTGEQKLIAKAADPGTMFWYLWSLKEAAYKIYNRETQIRAFMPLQLECYSLECKETVWYAKVRREGRVYHTQTTIVRDCIDTVAVLKESDFEHIVTLESTLVIEKENGIPYYYENTVLQPLSKSHHGRFERVVTLVK